MTTHVTGKTGCTNSPAQALSAHRRAIMDMLVGHPLITTAEYDTAMQRTLACQSVATLQKWHRNTAREITRRQKAASTTQALANMAKGIKRFEAKVAPVLAATAEQTSEVHKLALHRAITEDERSQALQKLPTLTTNEATALIGALWGRIVLRQHKVASSTVSAC